MMMNTSPTKANKFLLIILFSLSALNAMSQWVAPPKKAEEWYLFTPDKINLYMYEFGKGDTVIVLHGGFGAEHSYLLDLLVPLQDKFHFVCFDQRGSLRSPAADSLITFPNMLKDIELIRKALKLNKVTLFAHSMGTVIAMSYAATYPTHVKSLTLTGAFAPKSDSVLFVNTNRRSLAIRYLSNRPAVNEIKKKQHLDRGFDSLLAQEKTRSWRIGFASVNIIDLNNYNSVHGGVGFYKQQAADAIFQSGTVPGNWDHTSVLNQYHIPVTVVNGEYDYVDFTAFSDEELFVRNAKYIADNKITKEHLPRYYSWKEFMTTIPTLQLHIIKNAAHHGWTDAPAEYKRYLQEGLRR